MTTRLIYEGKKIYEEKVKWEKNTHIADTYMTIGVGLFTLGISVGAIFGYGGPQDWGTAMLTFFIISIITFIIAWFVGHDKVVTKVLIGKQVKA